MRDPGNKNWCEGPEEESTFVPHTTPHKVSSPPLPLSFSRKPLLRLTEHVIDAIKLHFKKE